MTATKITAADARVGDCIARSAAAEFERVTLIEEMGPRRRFWFGRQRIGSSRPGARSMSAARTATIWREDRAA